MLRILKHKVVQGTLLYTIVGILTSGMNILLLPVLTRWMAPDEFGLLSSAMAISALLMPFVTVGLGAAVVRYFHEYRDDAERFSRFFSAAFWFQILAVVFVVLSVLIAFGSCGLKDIAGVNIFHMIPVLCVIALNPPRDLGNQLLTTQENHGSASVNQLVAFATGTVFSLWFIGALEMGALGRLYGLACGAAAAALMLIKLPALRENLKFSIDRDELKIALKFGSPYIPHAFAMAAMLSADKLILQHFMDLEKVGIYSAAKSVAVGMSFVFVAITRAWYPRYFILRDTGKDDKALLGQWAILCVLPAVVIGFMVLFPVVFPLLVDKRYVEGQMLLPVLGMAVFAYGLFMTQASYITYLKKTIYLPCFAGGGVVLNLLLASILIPKWGMIGAAWATMGGYFLMVAVLLVSSAKFEGRVLERLLLPCVSIVVAVLGVLLCSYIPDGWMWGGRFIVLSGASLIVFVMWYGGQRLLSQNLSKV